MSPKLRALLHFIAPRVPTATHMRIIAAFSDFDAYARRGQTITETSAWRKGHEFAYPDGMTEASWMRATRRIFRAHQPLHLVVAGDLIAAYALLKMVRAPRAWRDQRALTRLYRHYDS